MFLSFDDHWCYAVSQEIHGGRAAGRTSTNNDNGMSFLNHSYGFWFQYLLELACNFDAGFVNPNECHALLSPSHIERYPSRGIVLSPL